MRWLRRNADWISIGLTSYALAITVVLAAGFHWCLALLLPLPLMLGVPSALAVVQRYRRKRVADSLTNGILATSVAPNHYPLCYAPEATLACGKSAAGLAARHLDAAIGHLLIMLAHFEREVDRERFFGEKELAWHLMAARRIHAALMVRLRGDLAVRCSRLAQGVTAIYDDLNDIYEEIGENIVQPLYSLSVAPQDDPDRQKRIQHVIKKVIKAELERLRRHDGLPRLQASAKQIAQRMADEWDGAAVDLRLKGCRPCREEGPPKMPDDIAEFLAHIA